MNTIGKDDSNDNNFWGGQSFVPWTASENVVANNIRSYLLQMLPMYGWARFVGMRVTIEWVGTMTYNKMATNGDTIADSFSINYGDLNLAGAELWVSRLHEQQPAVISGASENTVQVTMAELLGTAGTTRPNVVGPDRESVEAASGTMAYQSIMNARQFSKAKFTKSRRTRSYTFKPRGWIEKRLSRINLKALAEAGTAAVYDDDFRIGAIWFGVDKYYNLQQAFETYTLTIPREAFRVTFTHYIRFYGRRQELVDGYN